MYDNVRKFYGMEPVMSLLEDPYISFGGPVHGSWIMSSDP